MCLLQFSECGSQVGSPASTPVNAVLGDAGFKEVFGRAPGPKDQEETRLRAHLQYVTKVLRGCSAPGALKEKRLELLKALEIYAERGALPVNVELPEVRNPVFIDPCGNSCAVAHLMQVSGHGALANAVNEHFHFATISEIALVADPHSASKVDAAAAKVARELLVWAGEHGFSAEDLAAIQPGYTAGAMCFYAFLFYQPLLILLNFIFSVACRYWAAQSPEVFSKLPVHDLDKVMVFGCVLSGAALMVFSVIIFVMYREHQLEMQELEKRQAEIEKRQAANPPFAPPATITATPTTYAPAMAPAAYATPSTPNMVPTTQSAQQSGTYWASVFKDFARWFVFFTWVGSILTFLMQTFTLVLSWTLGLLPPVMKVFATLACISVALTIIGAIFISSSEEFYGPRGPKKKKTKQKKSIPAGAKCCSGEDCVGTGAGPFWVDDNDSGQFYCEACWDDFEEEGDEENEAAYFYPATLQPQIRQLYTLLQPHRQMSTTFESHGLATSAQPTYSPLKPPLGNRASFSPQPVSFKAPFSNGSSFSTRFTNGSSFSNGSNFSNVSSFQHATMR